MAARQKQYEQQEQIINQLEKNIFKVIPFLENVSKVTPWGVYIAKLAITADEGVNVTFISHDPVETANILVGLRKLDVFQTVAIETVPFAEGLRPVEFKLRFKWAGEISEGKASKEANGEAGQGPDIGEINTAIKEAQNKIKPQ